MFHSRHFVRHLGICNPICVKLLQIMFCVIPRNEKKLTSLLNRFPEVHKRGICTHTHRDTNTHDDSIRRNAMPCISPNKNHLHLFSLGWWIGIIWMLHRIFMSIVQKCQIRNQILLCNKLFLSVLPQLINCR